LKKYKNIEKMICLKCQHANSEKANFCEQCGSAIVRMTSSDLKEYILEVFHEYTNNIPGVEESIMSYTKAFEKKKQFQPLEEDSDVMDISKIPIIKEDSHLFRKLYNFTVKNDPKNWDINIPKLVPYGNDPIEQAVNWEMPIYERKFNQDLSSSYVAKRIWDYFFSEFLIKFKNMINDHKEYDMSIYSIDPLFNKPIFTHTMFGNNRGDTKSNWKTMTKKIGSLNLENTFIVYVKIVKYLLKKDYNGNNEYHYNQLFVLTAEDIENMFPLKGKSWLSNRFKEISQPWASFEKLMRELKTFLEYECSKHVFEHKPSQFTIDTISKSLSAAKIDSDPTTIRKCGCQTENHAKSNNIIYVVPDSKNDNLDDRLESIRKQKCNNGLNCKCIKNLQPGFKCDYCFMNMTSFKSEDSNELDSDYDPDNKNDVLILKKPCTCLLNMPADFKCSHNFDDIFKSKRNELIRKYHESKSENSENSDDIKYAC